MNYDLSIKEDRLKFKEYAQKLMDKMRTNVCLVDESERTLNQNAYLHVLFRIVADYTGDSEEYVKQVHFKLIVNPEIFVKVTKDKTTGKMLKYIRSTAEVDVGEMSRAIDNFIRWSAEQGITLPEAQINTDHSVSFASQQDANAFHQAQRMV